MHSSSAAQPIRGLSVDRTGPEICQLLLVGLPERLQRPERLLGLGLVDPRDREADVDQHPVADADRLRPLPEQADVAVAADTRDVNLGDAVLCVDDLDDLAWDPKAHG